MDVTVNEQPDGGLIIQAINADATAIRAIVAVDQIFHPLPHGIHIHRRGSVVRIVGCNVRAVRFDAIAALGIVRIGFLLRSVLGDRETTELVAGFRDPADHGDGPDGARSRGPAKFHYLVEFRIVPNIRSRIRRREVFVVPVTGGVVGVEQPVVTSGQIPAPAPYGQTELAGKSLVGVIVDAVNVGTNGMVLRGGVAI